MNNLTMRIDFIAEYISAYESKIKLLNKNGLFDNAKLFELFAIEVGSLYLGQRLSSLNIGTYQYPCVDLIAEDKMTFVQVSTEQNLPSKIKRTLESIRDSKNADIKAITCVKFIVLDNDSVTNVKNYTGDEQIGDVHFIKADDLITTKDIVEKATTNLAFQENLYDLLKSESEGIKNNSENLTIAIEKSKNIGLADIICKIKSEYTIPRDELISKIKTDNHKYISVQGEAGSGKSVLCKMLVENENIIVYARAERFSEETNINNIWGFDVRQTLKHLGNNPVIFFIDALEFIADHRNRSTTLNLLQELYECTKKYSNAKIITSCRTSDKSAFMKIENAYSVFSYEVPQLTSTEQSAIADKYPIIKKMFDMNAYAELLKSPFYINQIVSKVKSIDNISDENELREYIWQHIICLNSNEIMKAVESIVFTRAENFLLGVESKNYSTKIIERLISESVLVQNEKTVRMKYDIFEDICFEQHLDSEFDKCKGKYDEFFIQAENLGRCVYRRYQIWISNKLLAQSNREKFLYELVFDDKMPQNWRKQTMIGLVKSRHCANFFKEYAQDIIKNGMFNEFIKTTNLYAFEIVNNELVRRLSRQLSYIQLNPNGAGRGCLIQLIAENKLHENNCIPYPDVVKLCSDYAKIQNKDKQTAKEACLILEYFVNKSIEDSKTKDFYRLDDKLIPLLNPIYQMAEYSSEWIKTFWKTMVDYFKSGSRETEMFSVKIIKNTLKYENSMLAKYLPRELCELAENFWTYTSPPLFPYDYHSSLDSTSQYGLNENAEQYSNENYQNTPFRSNFFHVLFYTNFWIGLDWAIDFVNKTISHFDKEHSDDLPTYQINFIDDSIKRDFLGFSEMWSVATQEHPIIPTLLNDLIYCLKDVIREHLNILERETAIKFAVNIKNRIFEKSNNIALLTIIADIGTEFMHEVAGLALDLATNIDIVLLDMSKSTVMPFLRKRYGHNSIKHLCLLDYVCVSQLQCREEVKSKCHKILDYLYSIIPNNKQNATKYLQIQKMDVRTAKISKVDDATMEFAPTVSGEAKKLTDEWELQRQPNNDISTLIKEYHNKLENNNLQLNDCLTTIEKLKCLMEKCAMPNIYEKHHVDLLCYALKNNTLGCDERADFCRFWIDGIRKYFSNGIFMYDRKLSCVLFKQLETEVCDEVKNQIKQLILDLILYTGQNGIISEIARFANDYLKSNAQLAKAIFNAIVKLSEDEMNHQKYNVAYHRKYIQEGDDYEFIPNMLPKLSWVDSYIEKENGETYQNRKSEIITEYLYNKTSFDLSDFNMDNHDISTTCSVVKCGLTLSDTEFIQVIKKMLIVMIDIWKGSSRKHNAHDILGVYSVSEIVQFLQNELVKSETTEKVLDIMFNDVDFSIFVDDTIKFYLDAFSSLPAVYLDSHSNKSDRENCVGVIRALEKRIIKINNEKVKVELYKSLILFITGHWAMSDWSNCKAGYVYGNIMFLNGMFKKYGVFHIEEMLHTIYKLHYDKLLPNILLSISYVFKKSASIDDGINYIRFIEAIRNKKYKTILLRIITKTFFDFSDQIKKEANLTEAFEGILEILANNNYEEAATILDEFRIH